MPRKVSRTPPRKYVTKMMRGKLYNIGGGWEQLKEYRGPTVYVLFEGGKAVDFGRTVNPRRRLFEKRRGMLAESYDVLLLFAEDQQAAKMLECWAYHRFGPEIAERKHGPKPADCPYDVWGIPHPARPRGGCPYCGGK